MSKIKKILNVLEYFSNNYQDEYAIACSLLIYVDTSKKDAISKEMTRRVNMFKDIENNIHKHDQIFEILDDLMINLGLKYGENSEILYENNFTLNYKFLCDFCKGASMITSIYAKEYKDMNSLDYKRRLSTLLIKINNNLNEPIIETNISTLDKIVNNEIKYIVQLNMNKTSQEKKLLNYNGYVKRKRNEYINNLKIKEDNIKKLKNANIVIGKAIGVFMIYLYTAYKIEEDDYELVINGIKEQFKDDYTKNIEITDEINNIAINILNKNCKNLKSKNKNWENEGIYYNNEILIKEVVKIKNRKHSTSDDLINEMREINSYLKDGINSVKVKTIVEEVLNNKKIEDTIKNVPKDTKQDQDEKFKSTFKFKLSNLNPFRSKK